MSTHGSHITMASFVWSTTTLVLNRSMLHVRRVEVVSAFVCGRLEPERAASPSSVAETQLHEWALEDGVYDKMAELMPTHSRGTSAGAIELRKVSHWGAIFDEDDEHAQSRKSAPRSQPRQRLYSCSLLALGFRVVLIGFERCQRVE